MPSDELIELVLTCASWQKAAAIVDELFAANLILSAEYLPSPASSLVESIYHRTPKINVVVLARVSDSKFIKEKLSATQQLMAITQSIPAVTANICDIN
jgi:response regulator of citrate/malate metabolism